MNFGAYVDALLSTDFFGKSKAKIGSALFRAAGPCVSFSEEAVKTWINGTRSCNIERYFPEMKMNDAQFITYFRQRAKAPGSWEKIQEAFSSKFAAGEETRDICVDLTTEDPGVFYWSLLNQFQRIFHLPESEQEVRNSEAPIIAAPQRKFTREEIQDLFLKATSACEVMDTINRKPAILNRNDSARLNAFLDRMDFLIPDTAPCNDLLHSSIRSFIEALRIQVLSLDATLNNRFDFDDDTAFVNMEDDEDWNNNRGKRSQGKRSQEKRSQEKRS